TAVITLQILPYLGTVKSSGTGLADFCTGHTVQTAVLTDFQGLLRNSVYRTFLNAGLAVSAQFSVKMFFYRLHLCRFWPRFCRKTDRKETISLAFFQSSLNLRRRSPKYLLLLFIWPSLSQYRGIDMRKYGGGCSD